MRAVWLTGGAALALFAGMGAWLSELKPSVVALQFAFLPRPFGEIVHQWGPEGLARFRAHFFADYPFLLLYGLFGVLLARRSTVFDALSRPGRQFATGVLPAAAVCDALENTLHLWLTAAPRFGIAWPYELAATAATLKWAGLIAWGLTLAWAQAKSFHR